MLRSIADESICNTDQDRHNEMCSSRIDTAQNAWSEYLTWLEMPRQTSAKIIRYELAGLEITQYS